MKTRDLVVAKASPGTNETPVFVTEQSLITFPVAALAVNVIWRVLGAMVPAWANNLGVGIVVAFAIGLFIYALSVDWVNYTTEQKLKALGIAIINCFFLAASALGLFDVFGGAAPK